MLEPQDRRLLMEALRPPAGMALDFAVSTTFSLDLLALLVAPMAFTFFDCETEDGKPDMAPMALLQALRRNSGKLAVFCQAGQIKVPPKDQRLFACLEESVHQVILPADGVFHPKVWLLRFEGEDSVAYRLICSSRNLTFDRSWDTLLVLDGELRRDRKNGMALNRPLGDFIGHLPSLVPDLKVRAQQKIAEMADEVRRVEFKAPEGLKLEGFFPLGIPGYGGWPFKDTRDRFLVISPFLEKERLERLAGKGKRGVLISRADSLGGIPADTLSRFEEVLVFDSAFQEAASDGEDEQANSDSSDLLGLHAKLFVADDGWDARIWTGSANATDAAFRRNVEFLVELRGSKSKFGIDVTLGDELKASGLRPLLLPWEARNEGDTLELQQKFDEQALAIRLNLARGQLHAVVSPADEDGVFSVELTSVSPIDAPGCTVRCWPITTASELISQSLEFAARPMARFPRISYESLTPFFAFRVRQSIGEQSQEFEFVLKLSWQGAPQDRQEQLIRQVITNARDFLAYLIMLADTDAGQGNGLRPHPRAGKGGGAEFMISGTPVFEALLRCLDRSPERLDEIASLVEDMSKNEAAAHVIPHRFMEVWQPVWQARQLLKELK